MKTEKSTTYPIRIDKKLKADYVKFCLNNGFSMAGRIRWLIAKDMTKKK